MMPATSKKTRTSAQQKQQKERAKRILVEIIRQNGGTFTLKTNLYKAFYHAHLRYAEENSGYLSEWAIVRMPQGPGIDDANILLNELVAEGYLTIEDCGHYEGFSFALTAKADLMPEMHDEEVAAIKYGVRCVAGRSARQNSRDSHAKSRSWRAARDGQELNIYADLSDERQYRRRVKFFRRVGPILEKAFRKQSRAG